MDPFKNNKLLERRTFYSLDWGFSLKKGNDRITPFILLFDDNEMKKIIAFQEAEDNYLRAIELLKKSKESFSQFFIIYEAQMMSNEQKVIDTIIVKGFDKRQKEGVFMFQELKKNDVNNTFELIDRPKIIDLLPLELELLNESIPEIEPPSFNIIKAKKKETNNFDILALTIETNVSVINSSVKDLIESYLKIYDKENLSGNFIININYLKNDKDLLAFLLKRTFNKIISSDFTLQNFIYKGKTISLEVTCKDEVIFADNTKELSDEIGDLVNIMANVSNNNITKQKVLRKKWWEFWK